MYIMYIVYIYIYIYTSVNPCIYMHGVIINRAEGSHVQRRRADFLKRFFEGSLE